MFLSRIMQFVFDKNSIFYPKLKFLYTSRYFDLLSILFKSYGPVRIKGTKGLVLGPSTTLHRLFLMLCTVIKKAVRTL